MNILKKLTIKHLKMNKKRTIVTIIGVLLSTALMVGIGLLFSTVRDYTIKEVINYNGSHHVSIKNITYDKSEMLKNNILIKNLAFEKGIGFAYFKDSINEYKPYFYIDGGNDKFLSTLKLIKGRLPKNSDEVVVSEHILESHNYKIGEKLDLNLGERFYEGENINTNDTNYLPVDEDNKGEKLKINDHHIYTIVGIVKRSFHESYFAPGYQIYTKINNFKGDDIVTSYITYKKVSKVYDKTDSIVKNLGLKVDDTTIIDYNESLISILGASKYSNMTDSITGVILIILGLISIGCIIVIYNSFAISVMERKKQFGLFSSIGATQKQLRKSVFYEAFIIGMIGIPLGILSGFLGIWVVIEIINSLISEMFIGGLVLSAYPLFIIIPIAFMIIVVFFSAFLPAKKASKITPIEAIRLNDDIKIKGKKIKTNKLVRIIFGVEGEIAFKNMKRNKKKYRITIISLIVSIVLFISFSSFLTYAIQGTDVYLNEADFDIAVSANDEDKELLNSVVNDIISDEEVDKSIILKTQAFYTKSLNAIFSKDYKKVLDIIKKNRDNDDVVYEDNIWNHLDAFALISVDDKNYQAILKEIGLKEERPILINRFSTIIYSENARKSYNGKLLQSKKGRSFPICNVDNIHEGYISSDVDKLLSEIDCSNSIDNIYETDKIPFSFKYRINGSSPQIIVSEKMYNDIILKNNKEENDTLTEIYINADKYTNLDKKINNYVDEHRLSEMYYKNIVEEQKMIRNISIVVKMLFYGFIILVTLIGVTSVINTINTSIALRRREFAVLRSIGLTPKGFNRILHFETLLVGLKSLFYGLIISFGVICLIARSMGNIVEFNKIIIPWMSIVYAVTGVFAITSLTMRYATKKVKKDNILTAIREENI